jgi:Coenzyme PQQ synthesis protein D (PqqD)
MNNLTTPKARNSQILVQELEKELLIYDLKINKAFSLNETCAMVWRECDGVNDIDEITQKLSLKTRGLVNHEVVWLALESLKKDNLLIDDVEIPKLFNGLTRREVIRKVGFASMVAIPVITFLVAPTVADAASSPCRGAGFLFPSSGPGNCSLGAASCIPRCQATSGICCNGFTAIACTSSGSAATIQSCSCRCS